MFRRIWTNLSWYCFTLLGSILPIKKNTVLFLSFHGQYNDNPKYVSLLLHKLYPEVKQIWIMSPRCHEALPPYVKTISGKFKTCIYSGCTQVVVDNLWGIRTYLSEPNPFKRILVKWCCRKRKNQYNISTWHGTPLKRIGLASLESQNNMRSGITSSDYLISGCKFTQSVLKTAFGCDIPIKMYGTPRNDILFNSTVDVVELKQKLHLPADRKIILFAPTFRKDVNISGIEQMNTFDFNELFSALEQKFGGKWCFVFRVHQEVLLNIDTAALAEKYGDQMIDGNIGDDMAEYLVCTDVLLNDYSSSMFDFALTKRPCFLYAPDLKHYKEAERGLNMEYESLPFPAAYTSEQLIDQIRNFDQEQYTQKVDEFLEKLGDVEDGKASQRIVDDIVHFIKTGEKQ